MNPQLKISSKSNRSLIDLWFGCGSPGCQLQFVKFFFSPGIIGIPDPKNGRMPCGHCCHTQCIVYSKLKLPDSNILQDTGCPLAMFEVRIYHCDTILWFGKELTLVLSSE